jgi:uncharacterized protein YbjT (DUF2867 family)
MKIVLAGAYGNLGSRHLPFSSGGGTRGRGGRRHRARSSGLTGNFTFRKLDVTEPEALKGLCDGADIVISTVGLTKASATVDNYQIDYHGNLNLLNEAKAAGVGKFVYISVLKADQAPKVPMLHAKYLMEQELEKSGLDYIIYRPTGYFYDIVKVFRPMIEKGSVTLLGRKPVSANVIDTPDFADYIVAHLDDKNCIVSIGGKETYTYEQIARMCFAAAGKKPVIKHAPPFLFDILAAVNRRKKNGKEAIIRFSKWTLSQPMVGETKAGEHSFAEYIREQL